MQKGITELIVNLSPVSTKNQKVWKKVSIKCIKQGIVEPLTERGLIQAIDRLAYEIAADGNWCAMSNLSDEECDKILDNKIKQMDQIIHTVALASGIHPTSIDYLVGIRSDYYVSILIDKINGDVK